VVIRCLVDAIDAHISFTLVEGLAKHVIIGVISIQIYFGIVNKNVHTNKGNDQDEYPSYVFGVQFHLFFIRKGSRILKDWKAEIIEIQGSNGIISCIDLFLTGV